MSKAKLIDTPIMNNHSLSLKVYPKTPADKAKMTNVPYVSAIKSLIYTMVCTRSNHTCDVGLLSWLQSNPIIPHWNFLKRVLGYIVGTTVQICNFEATRMPNGLKTLISTSQHQLMFFC